MGISLDGVDLFGEDRQAKVTRGDLKRDYVERACAGVDGVLRIDCGQRGREIRQRGELRAKSSEQMEEMIDAIRAFQDGKAHLLIDARGSKYSDVCLDVFKAGKMRMSGAGVSLDYEIVYRQLKV